MATVRPPKSSPVTPWAIRFRNRPPTGGAHGGVLERSVEVPAPHAGAQGDVALVARAVLLLTPQAPRRATAGPLLLAVRARQSSELRALALNGLGDGVHGLLGPRRRSPRWSRRHGACPHLRRPGAAAPRRGCSARSRRWAPARQRRRPPASRRDARRRAKGVRRSDAVRGRGGGCGNLKPSGAAPLSERLHFLS